MKNKTIKTLLMYTTFIFGQSEAEKTRWLCILSHMCHSKLLVK